MGRIMKTGSLQHHRSIQKRLSDEKEKHKKEIIVSIQKATDIMKKNAKQQLPIQHAERLIPFEVTSAFGELIHNYVGTHSNHPLDIDERNSVFQFDSAWNTMYTHPLEISYLQDIACPRVFVVLGNEPHVAITACNNITNPQLSATDETNHCTSKNAANVAFNKWCSAVLYDVVVCNPTIHFFVLPSKMASRVANTLQKESANVKMPMFPFPDNLCFISANSTNSEENVGVGGVGGVGEVGDFTNDFNNWILNYKPNLLLCIGDNVQGKVFEQTGLPAYQIGYRSRCVQTPHLAESCTDDNNCTELRKAFPIQLHTLRDLKKVFEAPHAFQQYCYAMFATNEPDLKDSKQQLLLDILDMELDAQPQESEAERSNEQLGPDSVKKQHKYK